METPNPELVGKACKGYGKLEEIQIQDITNSCFDSAILKTSKENKLYKFYTSLQKDTPECSTESKPQTYTVFSGGEFPKIGDTIYFTSIYVENTLTSFGEKAYQNNEHLPDCGAYVINPLNGTYDIPINYDIMQDEICRVSGVIQDISRNFTDTCGLVFQIQVQDSKNTYIVGGREYFSGQGVSLCLGQGSRWFPIDSTDGIIESKIHIGDTFSALINSRNNSILRHNLESYEVSTKIPLCKSATFEQVQNFSGGLSGVELQKIMNAVEKEVQKGVIDTSMIASPLGRDETKQQLITQEKVFPRENTSSNFIKALSPSIQKPGTLSDSKNTLSEKKEKSEERNIENGLLGTNVGNIPAGQSLTETEIIENQEIFPKKEEVKSSNFLFLIFILSFLLIGIFLLKKKK